MAKKLTTKEFVEKAVQVHGDKYDYSKVEYKGCYFKVTIVCDVHGDFTQKPIRHSSGVGCRKCSRASTAKANLKNTSDFIYKSKEIHGNRFIYDSSTYIGCDENIHIKCVKHGVFKTTPSRHYRNIAGGCDKCYLELKSRNSTSNSSGWDLSSWIKSSKTSLKFDDYKIYIIKCTSDNEVFYKVGRTFTKLKYRFIKAKMPYKYKVVEMIKSKDPSLIFNLEIEIKSLSKHLKYKPSLSFNGSNECFTHYPILPSLKSTNGIWFEKLTDVGE